MRYDKLILTILALAAIHLPPLHAADSKAITQLRNLTETDQLDQRCDLEGMERLKADKVIAYTFSNPVRTATEVMAAGAVFRRNGEWYRLSYECKTSEDRMNVISFNYRIGSRIPHEEWSNLFLYP
ncbi:DUF930 domain-containing protein [Limoniibacter endophyticus]|uniref:DUF930 domain-containing protein n=1 Tax=Limoniibacter endophyticus TaxID=1565040 RepID=A0A8J3GH40_9HYPH|nr:DUF930 domain-containing protein [Limoniibacter endophyticus]GHC64185.1 hypothetical protein GCM10010136_06000 [Limoniibacter endophyticus]